MGAYLFTMSFIILREAIRTLLIEAKVDDLIAKSNSEYTNDIQVLNSNDPSPTKKYLQWAVKQLVTGKSKTNDLIDVMKDFHKYGSRLAKKDINAWNFQELYNTLDDIRRDGIEPSKRQAKIQVKSAGAERIYEDSQCVVLHIKDKASACFYGANTKWCITMNNSQYYEQYTGRDNVVFVYVLRKDLEQDDPRFKVALAYHRKVMAKHHDQGPLRNVQIEAFNASDFDGSPTEFLSDLQNLSSVLAAGERVAKTQPDSLVYRVITGDADPDELSDTQFKSSEEHLGMNVPTRVLIQWALSNDERVRRSAAKNPRTPVDLLVKLVSDPDYFVVADLASNRFALRHPAVIDAIIDLSLRQNDSLMLRRIVREGHANPELLVRFASVEFDDASEQSSLRDSIARSPRASTELLKILAADTNDAATSYSARNVLDGRGEL